MQEKQGERTSAAKQSVCPHYSVFSLCEESPLFILLKVQSLQKKAKIFNTEKTEQTEITKLKGVFQALPSPFALFSPC